MPEMNLTPNKPTQIELFPRSGGQVFSTANQPFVIKDLTLSAENIIVLGIIFIVSMVVFFSVGVERGKHLVKASLPSTAEIVTAAEQQIKMPADSIIVPRALGPEETGISAKPAQDEPNEKRQVLEIPIDEHFRYTIQVASFKSLQYAQKEVKSLESRGHESFIMPKGNHQIVCVGRFSAKGEAKQYAHKIKDRYQDYLIRSR